MEKKAKIKYRKINTITEFDKRKLEKENQKYEQQMRESEKYFGKKKLLKVDYLRNIIPPFEEENRTLPKNSKNSSMLFFAKRKLRFDLSKPVYLNTKKNLLTLKSTNNNIILKKKFKTFRRNTGNNSGKSILNRQKDISGFNRQVIISRSCLNFAFETKYTSNAKNIKTSIEEEQKNQNINYNNIKFYIFNINLYLFI